MTIKSELFGRLLTVFLLGGTFASPAFGRDPTALLHVPWGLLEKRLESALGANSSLLRSSLPDGGIDIEGLRLNLSGARFDAQIQMDRPLLNGSRFEARFQRVSLRLGLDRVSIDQVVERNIGGALVRVHIKASCGPLRAIQENARAETAFDLDWSSGTPLAALRSFDLAWDPGSWSVAEFSCEGPEGLAEFLHPKVLEQLKDPVTLKPFIADFLARETQELLDESLLKLKKPFELNMGVGAIAVHASEVKSLATGLTVELTFGQAGAGAAPPPVLTEDFLAALPKDQPTVIGGTDVIERMLNTELKARPAFSTVDLQKISAFRDLLQSRFLQFFVWPDLWRYSPNSPFQLKIKTPRDLNLRVRDGGLFAAKIPLSAVVQSQRDATSWDYVTAEGQAQAHIRVRLAAGILSYQTELRGPMLSARYGDAYMARYRPSGWLPTSTLTSMMKGPQSALSGTMTWPEIDMGEAGRYKASSLNWRDDKIFILNWSPTTP